MGMTTAAGDASLLQLIWLASPALPIGGFSYSEGLEAAVEHGRVTDEASAARWLSQQLRLSLARADLSIVGEAVLAWRACDFERIVALNDWVLQTRETSELRLQAVQMGRSMLEWLKSLGRELPAMPPSTALAYPLAFAFAASGTLAAPREAMLAFAFGWAENMAQAAIKSVPLGQGSGQRMLMRLAAEIPLAVDDALSRDAATRQAFAPMLSILSARHETQYSRLFRS